jgi:hypothetical protein
MASLDSSTPASVQAFKVYVPLSVQPHLDRLPRDTRHELLGELFRLALQAWQERCLFPRQSPVTLHFRLVGCDVSLEFDSACCRMTVLSLLRNGLPPRRVSTH